jgi:hypothetical protein
MARLRAAATNIIADLQEEGDLPLDLACDGVERRTVE